MTHGMLDGRRRPYSRRAQRSSATEDARTAWTSLTFTPPDGIRLASRGTDECWRDLCNDRIAGARRSFRLPPWRRLGYVSVVPLPTNYEVQVRAAVAHYWRTLDLQSSKQRSGDADRGRRAAVTGGKQMNGFCELMTWLLKANGMSERSLCFDASLALPGFFRPTKRWDMLVVDRGTPIAAMEFKSHRGPSFGNNFNNRSEEAVGTGADIARALREGAFGRDAPQPWLGWVMLLEETRRSTESVGVLEPHFSVLPEFRDSSYAKRYEILLRKLRLEKLYSEAALLMTKESAGLAGEYTEPAADLSMKRFLAGLAGHVRAYIEGH